MKIVLERTVSLRVDLTPGEVAQLRADLRTMDPPYGGGLPAAPWQNPSKWPLALSLLHALVAAVSEEGS